MFNIVGSYFCKDKFGAKNGGTPPPNAFRQNGMSVLPFVYFQQSRYIEIVKVILLSIKKSKKNERTKNMNKNGRKCSEFVPCFFVQF